MPKDEQSADAKRDEVLRRMLKTPPKPLSEMKVGKGKAASRRPKKKKKAAP